jgi:hypothetical protein
MSYIKPIQDDILDEANSREPADRFIYLLELHQLLKTRARLIINTLTHEDCTAEIQSWLLEILHKEPVPPNYNYNREALEEALRTLSMHILRER